MFDPLATRAQIPDRGSSSYGTVADQREVSPDSKPSIDRKSLGTARDCHPT
jgi:hypothetical protein